MKQLIPALYFVGAVMVLVGAAVFITGWVYAPYIYTIGAAMLTLGQLNTPYRGDNRIIKRLWRQQVFGALFLLLAGAFMFFTTHNEWVAIFAIGTFLELYTAFRIPKELEKENK